jgi:Aldo/keto reductase family
MFKKADELAATTDGRKTPAGQTERDRQITAALDTIAQKHGTRVTSIALAYVRAKYAYVFPIIGGRNKEQLQSNIQALSIQLSPEEVEEIENAAPFDAGFPLSFLAGSMGSKYSSDFTTSDIGLVKAAAHLDSVPRFPKGPAPRKE